MQKIFSILSAFALLLAATSGALAQEAEIAVPLNEISNAPNETIVALDGAPNVESVEVETDAPAAPPIDVLDDALIGHTAALPDRDAPVEKKTDDAEAVIEPVSAEGESDPIGTEEAIPIEIKGSVLNADTTPISAGFAAVDSALNLPSRSGKSTGGLHTKLGFPARPARPCQLGTMCPRHAGTAQKIGTGTVVHHRYCPIMGPCIHNNNPQTHNLTTDDSTENPVPLFTANPLWRKGNLALPTGNTGLAAGTSAVPVESFAGPDPKIIGMADGRQVDLIPAENENRAAAPTNPASSLVGLISGANFPLLGLLALLAVGTFFAIRNRSKK